MRRRTLTLALTLSAAALAGCRAIRARTDDGGISTAQYVDAMVELRALADSAKTPAEFAARKQHALARLGVTDAEITRFAHDHATDVETMSSAWDSIESRLDRARPGRERVVP